MDYSHSEAIFPTELRMCKSLNCAVWLELRNNFVILVWPVSEHNKCKIQLRKTSDFLTVKNQLFILYEEEKQIWT